MSQTILQQIFNLQQRYNNKMMEYDDAMSEHMANVQQYKLICNTSKFKHCAGENEQCQVTGQKTVRYGPVESGSFIKVGDSKYCAYPLGIHLNVLLCSFPFPSTNICITGTMLSGSAPGRVWACH